MRNVSIAVVLGMWLLAVATPAQGGVTWQRRSPSTSPPAAASGQAMAYDWIRRRVVLLVGLQSTGTAAETWSWNGYNWRHEAGSAVSPQAPTGRSMVFHGVRNAVIVHGAGTWEWDGVNWTRLTPAQAPPPRDHHAMAYDWARGEAVLFGGQTWNDTWLFDGSNWTQASPAQSPPARSGHAMAFDDFRDRVVLFGGASGGVLGDTWEWDGSNWTQLHPAQSPPARDGHALVFYRTRQRVVLCAGRDGNGVELNDTWEWDGATWTPLAPAQSPSPRTAAVADYFVSRDRTVLFGGLDSSGNLNDTWDFASVAPAGFLTYGSGCPGSLGDPYLSAALGSAPWIGHPFSVEVSGLPQGCVPFVVLGFTGVSVPVPVLPGCTQLNTADVAELLTLNGTVAAWNVVVPFDTALVGWSLFFQGAVLNAGGANPLGGALSNGGEAVIGMR